MEQGTGNDFDVCVDVEPLVTGNVFFATFMARDVFILKMFSLRIGFTNAFTEQFKDQMGINPYISPATTYI